jgi:hypothetical protein
MAEVEVIEGEGLRALVEDSGFLAIPTVASW